ncbi:MAG: universal stress protein [Bacteroidales bacterium]|nr:universal stress protein [Bacteroidales bacterium]
MDTKMNNIILVPTDFSEVCENAMFHAAEAARYLKYKVLLLHVVDKNTKAQLKKDGKGIESIDEKLAGIAAEVKNKYAIDADHIAMEGDIFTTIAEVAHDNGANMIYLGTHGKVGMQKLTGSFALKVVTSSPVPVVVVQKKPFDKGYRKVILPITSDAGPWEKTKWAAFISKNFNSEIHIYQLDTPALEETIQIISKHFKEEGVEFKIIKSDGSNFSKQVIEYATANMADLVMIMTNPDKGFGKFILGSYDEEMIFNTSQIPVMCINPRKQNWEKIFKI